MKIKRSNLPAYSLTTIILLLYILSFACRDDFLLLGTYIIFAAWIVLKKKKIFLKYFYFIFITSWMNLSVFLIENTSMYVPNLQVNAFYSGALGPLLLITTISFLVIIQFDEYFEKKISLIDIHISRTKEKNYKYFVGAALIIILLFLADISHDNYFSSGASNRFYYLMATNAISVLYYGYLLFLIPVFSIYSKKTNKIKYLIIFSILYSAFLILIGTKFGGLFQVIYVVIITYLLPFRNEDVEKHYNKILLYAFIVFCVFFLYSFLQGLYEKKEIGLAIEQLINRISNGQGDVWWGVYSKFKGTIHLDELSDELGAFNTVGLIQADYNFGIYKLMKLIAPRSVVVAYGLQGARFAASTEASLYYYFGLIGCIFWKIILSLLMVLLINSLIIVTKKGYGFDAAIHVWLLTHLTRIYTMSDFYLLGSKSAIMCIMLILFFQIIHKPVKQKIQG